MAKTLWTSLDKLAPTQMNIGVIAMESKVKKILSKHKKGKLESYIKKKVAPAYLAKNGKYYIIDRHHTSRALYEANTPLKKFPVEVLADYSHLSMDEFFTEMNRSGKLYLLDNGEGPLSPFLLPEHIKDITDDPYRSLAWMVREKGGFKKVDVAFLEFIWSAFLREHIELRFENESELKGYLNHALKLAKSKKAKHLPGYIGKKKEEL